LYRVYKITNVEDKISLDQQEKKGYYAEILVKKSDIGEWLIRWTM